MEKASGCWVIKIDLKDAYTAVSIHNSSTRSGKATRTREISGSNETPSFTYQYMWPLTTVARPQRPDNEAYDVLWTYPVPFIYEKKCQHALLIVVVHIIRTNEGEFFPYRTASRAV